MYRLKRFIIKKERTDELRTIHINGFIISYQIFPRINAIATYVNNIPYTAYVFDTNGKLRQFIKTNAMDLKILKFPEIIEYPKMNKHFKESWFGPRTRERVIENAIQTVIVNISKILLYEYFTCHVDGINFMCGNAIGMSYKWHEDGAFLKIDMEGNNRSKYCWSVKFI